MGQIPTPSLHKRQESWGGIGTMGEGGLYGANPSQPAQGMGELGTDRDRPGVGLYGANPPSLPRGRGEVGMRGRGGSRQEFPARGLFPYSCWCRWPRR